MFLFLSRQCWCRAHGDLHSHGPSDFPDRKGKPCRHLWHSPRPAHAPVPHGADRGGSQTAVTSQHECSGGANVLGFSAGSVCVPKPVRHGHHQVQNRNQCGSHLPEHSRSVHLREHRTTQELLQVPGSIDHKNHSSLLPTVVKGMQVVLYKLCKPV